MSTRPSIAWSIYMHFERSYEWHQARTIGFYSSFAPEDLPSDYLGFWAFFAGYTYDEIPKLIENELGIPTVYDGSSFIFEPTSGTVPRNFEFSPMAPQSSQSPIGLTVTEWKNVAWPESLQLTVTLFEWELIE